jgi:hypothetical protein
MSEITVNTSSPFKIGAYRPTHLWGGRTICMNRLRFMDVHVDETVHDEVHAGLVVDWMRRTWVHLMYDFLLLAPAGI